MAYSPDGKEQATLAINERITLIDGWAKAAHADAAQGRKNADAAEVRAQRYEDTITWLRLALARMGGSSE